MIEAVFTFAFVSALFEFVVLMKLKPRTRCRVLGSGRWVATIHTLTVLINILIHFGTITGTMTAVTAGLVSFATIPFTRWVSGHITAGVYYPGRIRYTPQQLT